MAVRVETLEKSDLRKFIELNGNVRPEKSMSVYPVVSGKIAGSAVHLGSKVKKGDVIAYVDPSVPGSRTPRSGSGMKCSRFLPERGARKVSSRAKH